MLCFAAPTWGFRVEMKKKAGNSNQTPKQRTAPSQAGRQPSLKKQMEVRPLNEITQDMFTSNSITVSARWTNPAPVCCSLKRALCWFLFWEQQGESTFVTAGTKWPAVQTQFIYSGVGHRELSTPQCGAKIYIKLLLWRGRNLNAQTRRTQANAAVAAAAVWTCFCARMSAYVMSWALWGCCFFYVWVFVFA